MKRFYKLSILTAALFVALAFSLLTDTAAYAETSAESGGFSCTEVTEIPIAECQALVALFYSTDGPNWVNNHGWLHDYTPCDWHGITCNQGNVTGLNFRRMVDEIPHGNNLNGTIPPEIGYLTELVSLDLYRNQLSGPIPATIGSLTELTYLNIGTNQLSGSIPSTIGNLTKLAVLELYVNQLSGPIPQQIGNLTNLRTLSLYNNQLDGSIPSEIGKLTNLSSLRLDLNQLSGPVPSEIGDLSNLWSLNLRQNQLSGSIPLAMGNLNNLSGFYFDKTFLCLPDTLAPWFNNIPHRSGTGARCAPDYAICQSITEIPRTECEALVDLYYHTDGPNWTDKSGWLNTNQPCSWFGVTCSGGTVTRLQFMELSTETGNGLKGVIPASIVQLNNLTHLLLDFNDINMIPPYIGGLKKLVWLTMSDNGLQSVPSEIGGLENLYGLSLGFNQLKTLPPEIGRLTKLNHMNFVDNQLETLPPEIGLLVNVEVIYLDNNQLRTLPTEIGQMAGLLGLRVPNNPIVALPAGIGDLDNLRYMIFENNSLQSLPPEIGNLDNIQYINVAGNHLETLPVQIANLKTLSQFDIRSNLLSHVPAEILKMNSLGLFYPAYNRIATTDPELVAILDSLDHDWRDTQTVSPTNLTATWISQDSIQLTWTPIPFQGKGGYYEIHIPAIPVGGGGVVLTRKTDNKSVSSYTLTGMTLSTSYAFKIRTYTPAHDGDENGQANAGPDQRNELWSEFSAMVTPTTGPNMAIHKAAPAQMVGTDIYTLNVTNSGAAPEDSTWVYDTLPAGVRPVEVVTSVTGWACTIEEQDVECEYEQPFPSGQSHEIYIHVQVTVDAATTVENCAAVDIEDDIDYSNNESCVQSEVVPVQRDIYVSSSSGGKAGSVKFGDEDVLRFSNETWLTHFDGLDVGLKKWDVNALHIMDDNSILISLNRSKKIGGVKYDDSDIVRFTPSKLGNKTTGTFSMYFDGSDVQLTTGGEDIDAIGIASNGDIIISTLGTAKVGFTAKDEDLMRFKPTSLGKNTTGSWHPFFDGSDIGLSGKSEDVSAVWIDPADGTIHISTQGGYKVTSLGTTLKGDGDDIFTCNLVPNPQGNTQCQLALYWDGDAHGYGKESIDAYAVHSVTAPAPRRATFVEEDASVDEEDNEPDLTETWDDDVLEEEDVQMRIYLPLVNQ